MVLFCDVRADRILGTVLSGGETLRLALPFEVFDALAGLVLLLLEMVVGAADEGVRFLELPIDFGLILRVK